MLKIVWLLIFIEIGFNKPSQAQAIKVAIKTINGNYLTAASGGGLGGPASGPFAVALNTNATQVGPWEKFYFIWVDEVHLKFALQTINGNYITAVNGGGITGPNSSLAPIHTDATQIGPWEIFQLTYLNELNKPTMVTLQTSDGHYLTAVGGGGIGGSTIVPIHTDATKIDVWETFTFIGN